MKTIFVGALAWLMMAAGAAAEQISNSFDSAGDLKGWMLTGDVGLDKTKNHGAGGAASLRVGPGGKAVCQMRGGNGAGKVEMWVFDDMTSPKDKKGRRVGPRWGLIQADGHVLVMGALYAPYLAGAETYAASDSDQKTWFNVQYSRLKRKEGWHKWTFDFDAERGLSIFMDEKQKALFDWNKTKLVGFSGIAIFGDDGAAPAQTIWVDDVMVALAGNVSVKPVAPPPAAPVTPEKDPAAEKVVSLAEGVKGKHPRLLFSAGDIAGMRQRAAGGNKYAFERLMGYLPASRGMPGDKFLTDATDAQRQGVWRLPTVAMHYVITGDAKSRDCAIAFLKALIEKGNWETGAEQDSGMGAANIMVGAALAYDWLYDQLDPALRDACRKKLLLHARRMYHGGHLMKSPGIHYWQGDPQNNHRYHRDAGLALCALAVAGETPDADWIVAKTAEELKFIHDWLPEDGTCHESPSYMIFGNPYLMLALDAADHCLGTKYLDHSYFKNNPMFRMQTLTPGLKDVFCYGDSGGTGFINNYLYKCTSHFKLADLQAGILKFQAGDADAFQYGWFSLIWFDPTVEGGSIENLPKSMCFADLGIGFARDGWDAGNVGFMFKCGPYGGYTLNRYRNERQMCYVNVAHDDPDANMFVIYAGGRLMADDDRYSSKKLTSSHNTILVNGKGQKGEGSGWTQPLKEDMTKLANLIAFKATDAVVVGEGEAAGMYKDLERFRRSFIWVKGKYILILDDIRAKTEAQITWQCQGVDAAVISPGRFCIRNGGAELDFALAADGPFEAAIGESTADQHGKPLGWKQVQVKTAGKVKSWRVAAVFDAWGGKGLKAELKPAGAGMDVMVTGAGLNEVWHWAPAADGGKPSVLNYGEGK